MIMEVIWGLEIRYGFHETAIKQKQKEKKKKTNQIKSQKQ